MSGGMAAESLAALAASLAGSEASSAAEAARRQAAAGGASREYWVDRVERVEATGRLADIVVRFTDEADMEYRVRVDLLDDAGNGKSWQTAGTLLQSFLLTHEHRDEAKAIRRTPHAWTVDGSELL